MIPLGNLYIKVKCIYSFFVDIKAKWTSHWGSKLVQLYAEHQTQCNFIQRIKHGATLDWGSKSVQYYQILSLDFIHVDLNMIASNKWMQFIPGFSNFCMISFSLNFAKSFERKSCSILRRKEMKKFLTAPWNNGTFI